MADHTLGRRLVERAPEVKIFGKSYRLKAEVATLNAFSSHADYQEAIAWLHSQPIKSLKKIFLVHGEEEALKNLQAELLASGIPAVEIVDAGREYPLDA
jgi:metallo-beta-lactamase family protein